MNKEIKVSEQAARAFWATVKENKGVINPGDLEVQINCPYEVVKGTDFDIDKSIEI